MPFPLDHPLALIATAQRYKISEIDDAGVVKYYGFVERDGAWYILKEDTGATSKTYRYCSGLTDYPTNWGNRAISLVFGYYNEAF